METTALVVVSTVDDLEEVPWVFVVGSDANETTEPTETRCEPAVGLIRNVYRSNRFPHVVRALDSRRFSSPGALR